MWWGTMVREGQVRSAAMRVAQSLVVSDRSRRAAGVGHGRVNRPGFESGWAVSVSVPPLERQGSGNGR